MSQEHIEKFDEVAVNDSAVGRELVRAVQSPEEFVERTVATAADHGFVFDKVEAMAWIEEQRVMKANGELSDFQLEGVAGGSKTVEQAVDDGLGRVQQIAGQGTQAVGNVASWADQNIMQPVDNAFDTAAQEVKNWFQSW